MWYVILKDTKLKQTKVISECETIEQARVFMDSLSLLVSYFDQVEPGRFEFPFERAGEKISC